MTKKQLLTLVIMLTAIAAQGKKNAEMAQPEWLHSNTDTILTVTHVELTDTATVVSFHAEYKPNDWIRIAAASKLIGDDGKTYAARCGYGITLAKKFYMPESGKADFKVAFDPMPKNTRFIDFIEGPSGWSIWGIHERGTKMPKAAKKKKENYRITDESTFFRRGTGVIRGRFESKKRPNVVDYNGQNCITQTDRPMVFDVADDGTFEATITVDNPTFSFLSNKRNFYHFYVGAGDTLDISIADNGTVTYPESCEYARLLSLMSNEAPDIYIDYKNIREKASNMSMKEYGEWIRDETDRLLAVADYMAARRKLSPREAHLLRTNILLGCGEAFYEYKFTCNNKEELANTANYGFLRRIPADDLTCLMAVDEMAIYLNRYEFSFPIRYDRKCTQLATDSMAMAADREMTGVEKPSIYMQLTWLHEKNYTSEYEDDQERTLQIIKDRRENMTSEYLRSVLDKIEQNLIAPKTATRTLPEGKATDIFNAIMEKYRGKYVYVDFWGIFCGPCRAAIENSRQLRDSIAKRQDIEMVFITSERYSPQKEYDEYAEKHLKGEECYRIPDEDYRRLMALFCFNGIPHYELVAPDGRIVERDEVRSMFRQQLEMFFHLHEKMKKEVEK